MSTADMPSHQNASQLLSELVHNIDQGMALCDIENLDIIDFNQTFASWFGITGDNPALKFIFTDDILKRINNAITKKRIYRFKHITTVNRREQHLDLNAKVIVLANGQSYLFIQGIVNNNEQQMIKMVKDHSMLIEHGKQLLEEAVVKAESANNAKSMFLASMSHELRTPMNGILGMVQQLFKGELSEEQAEYLTTIQHSGDQLLAIINQVLDFSKIEAHKVELHPESVDMKQVIHNIVSLCSGAQEDKGTTIAAVVPEQTLPFLLVDDVRLKQVLINLLNNAIKFTQQGEISLELVLINTDKSHCQLQFTVNDTGIGIHPDRIEHLFEPFAQNDASTTRNFGGTGLGLTISNQLVGLMGGKIKVESELDKGSNFSFTLSLPISHQVEPEVMAKAPELTKAFFKNKKILVVDDTRINIKIMSMVISDTEAEIIVATNGQEAVEAFKSNNIDLILMDCLMPVMDGFEATAAIRAIEPAAEHTIILAVTASASEEIAVQCKASGMDDIILKPFKFDDLLAKLQSALMLNHQI